MQVTCHGVSAAAQRHAHNNWALPVQLISATDDGKGFDEEDAQLELDRGLAPPRFYIMKLPRRGLSFDRITYHDNVTQCLGEGYDARARAAGRGSSWLDFWLIVPILSSRLCEPGSLVPRGRGAHGVGGESPNSG